MTRRELNLARASFARRAWGDAYQQFATTDAAAPLDLDDLERFALAAYLCGLDEESTRAWMRAHRALSDAVATGELLLAQVAELEHRRGHEPVLADLSPTRRR